MRSLLNRWVVAVIGTFAALGLALVVGLMILGHGKSKGSTGPAAGALTIEQGAADSRTSNTKPLRCFVGGQYVGMATVAECAQKNGIAAQALDVGLDPATGAPATPSGSLAPAPQASPAPTGEPAEPRPDADRASTAPVAECLRYVGEGWRTAGSGQSVAQCARTLFEGRCGRPGEALYGRWGTETLRLVPGRVEMAVDNRVFHPLISQNPQDCSLSPE